MSQPVTTQITAIRTVGIPVTDQDRALAFYVDTLGLEVRLDGIFGNGRWVEVAPPGATTTIALVRAHDGVPAGIETGIRFLAAHADSSQAALRGLGVDTGPVLRWPGVPPMFAFRDPDSNGLEIVQDV